MPRRPPRQPRPLGVLHCTLTGSVGLSVLFLLSLAPSAYADLAASKRFLGVFTQAALDAPPPAFAEGLATALVIGGVAGAVWAITYNLLSPFGRP